MTNRPISKLSEIFNGLVGLWKLNREIKHPVTGNSYLIEGTANFSRQSPNELLYQEEVTIHSELIPQTLQGSQTYIYRYDNKEISIYFDESPPRLFQTLVFDKTLTTATGYHLCNQDHYRGEYLFTDQNQLQIRYTVQGPHKDYISTTNFKRS